ncbi:MAG: nucleotidyltransferase family protein [bacterium]
MIRRHHLVNAFEDEQRRRPAEFERNLAIYEGLWKEARDLGRFAQATLEGIGPDIDYARVINGRPAMRPTHLADVLRILHEHNADIKRFGVSGMSLFGSVARDEARPESDVDILVEFEKPVDLFTLVQLGNHLERLLERPVDLVTPGGLTERLRERIRAELVRAA